MNVAYIRKVAARQVGKRALDELTAEPSAPLDDVMLHKAAQAEDPELFRMAMTMPGDPIGNYEVLGGTFKKEAIGAPMFQVAAAPDPVGQVSQSMPSQPGSLAPKASTSTGPQGGGSSSNPGKIQSIQEPKIPGASNQPSGGGMG